MGETSAPDTVIWRAPAEADVFLAVLQDAAPERRFKLASQGAEELRLTVRASVFKRRRLAILSGSVSRQDGALEIAWTVTDWAQREHLLNLEEGLPAGLIDYHGLGESAANAGFTVNRREALRNVADSLGRGEVVAAAGRGRLAD